MPLRFSSSKIVRPTSAVPAQFTHTCNAGVGHAFDIDSGVSPEQIADKFDKITDFEDGDFPDSTQSSLGIVMSQLQSKL